MLISLHRCALGLLAISLSLSQTAAIAASAIPATTERNSLSHGADSDSRLSQAPADSPGFESSSEGSAGNTGNTTAFTTTADVDTSVIPEGYAFDAGDQIAIEVFGYEDFTGSWVVLPDGTIRLPLVGAVSVAGKTSDDLEILLARRLNNFLVDPIVAVMPSTLRPVVVTIAGEVQRPGPVQLRSLSEVNTNRLSNSGNRNVVGSQVESTLDAIPTVSSALIEAGGITRNADIRQVVLTRSQPGGEPVSETLNLWDSLLSDVTPKDLVLQDGDAIFVPQLSAEDTLDRRLLARSSLSPTTIAVRVAGEVSQPGEINIAPDSSLSGAIAAAGGPTPDARLRQVQLIRLNQGGQVEQQTVDLSNLTDENQVQAGDVIFVPERRSSRFLNTTGRILSPFISVLQGLNIIERILD
ncbi:MAG: SLBB domain-containing protein [Cyanobacteria bacterium P01_H01_bin.26]